MNDPTAPAREKTAETSEFSRAARAPDLAHPQKFFAPPTPGNVAAGSRIRSICSYPGCSALAAGAGRYCAAHRAERRRMPYGSSRYRRLRAMMLAASPACSDPYGFHRAAGAPAPADEIDHITPHRGDAALFWSPANWQPLCSACHRRKTGRESSAGPPAPA